MKLPDGFKLYCLMSRWYVCDKAGKPFLSANTKQGAILNAINGVRVTDSNTKVKLS